MQIRFSRILFLFLFFILSFHYLLRTFSEVSELSLIEFLTKPEVGRDGILSDAIYCRSCLLGICIYRIFNHSTYAILNHGSAGIFTLKRAIEKSQSRARIDTESGIHRVKSHSSGVSLWSMYGV